MPLGITEIALLAGIQGISEALPISRSAHQTILTIWLEPGQDALVLESTLRLGTALALLFAARKSLVPTFGEGLRAVARPALLRESPRAHDAAVLAIAIITSLLVRAALSPLIESWAAAPVAQGFGLVLLGMLVATLALFGEGEAESLPLALAPLLGLGHALGMLPGGSDIGAALILAIWMGQKHGMALDLSLMLTGATLLCGFAQNLLAPLEKSAKAILPLAFGNMTAFLGALVGVEILRFLLQRRAVPTLCFWIFPLAFATLTYARLSQALFHPYNPRETPIHLAQVEAP